MYDNFYGLTGRPFQLTPDPGFYFESITHRKALSYLGYGLAQGEGFIVITGEVGSGKSTLVAHLMASIDRNQLTAGQIVTSRVSGEDLVRLVAGSFGIDTTGFDKAAMLQAIEYFLHEEARAGRRCLLVVDESQNLSVEALEELRMLSNFQLGSHPLLQIFLLGQPEFRALLQSSPQLEQLRQRVIATHHLDAMEPGEIGAYVEHRLRCVGWTGNPAFDQRVYSELHRASQGIPRRVNQIVNRLMLLGSVEQRARIDAAMLQSVLHDMENDGSFANPAAAIAAEASHDDANKAAPPVPSVTAPTATAFDLVALEAALQARDQQIAELQHAILELSAVQDDAKRQSNGTPAMDPQFAKRIAALEAQALEQEQALRHTLTMMIEWIACEEARAQAA